jgi:hypothetical protein
MERRQADIRDFFLTEKDFARCVRRRLRSRNADGKDTRSQTQMALGQRIAAALLALTVICMATARYL